MIRLLDDQMDTLVDQMKAVKTRILKELRAVRKGAKGAVLVQARQLEYRKQLYDPARHRPVEVGRVVIDYKLLTSFEKKLKKCEVTYKLDIGGLTLEYKNSAGKTGTLRLHDMREVYQHIDTFPQAELVEPVLAE